MGMGDGKSVGGGVDTCMKRHFGRGGQITIHYLATEIDDRDHLSRDLGQVGPRRSHCDEVSVTGGDVASCSNHEPRLREVATCLRYGFALISQE